MEIIFTPAYATDPVAYITHKGVAFPLNTAALMRVNNAGAYKELFYHLNWYLNSLPEAQQKRIYDLYALAEETLRRSDDMTEVNTVIRDVFEDLYKELDADAMYNWIRPSERYPWPTTTEMPRSYQNAVSPKYPEEKTYVLSEYQQLFVLILQLRAAVPIWAAYLHKFNKDISPDFRDMNLVNLLSNSAICNTSAWSRLEMYINAWVGPKSENSATAVIHGISVEEYPYFLLCQAMLRKLSLQSLVSPQAGDVSPFVIKHLSNYIRECLQKNMLQFNTPNVKTVKSRDDPSADGDRSVYEANRVKESVPRNERWVTQIYLENVTQVLLALQPDIDRAVADKIIKSFDASSYVPTDDQMLVAMWVMSAVISPRSEDDLTRLNSVACCAISAAVLWHCGHKEVAIWLSSQRGTPFSRGMLSTTVRQGKDTYTRLQEIFPYSDKPKNPWYLQIPKLVTEIVGKMQENLWETQLPVELLQQAPHLFTGDTLGTMRVAQNMNGYLIEVVIHIGQRPLPEHVLAKAARISKELGLPSEPVPWDVVPPTPRPLMQPK